MIATRLNVMAATVALTCLTAASLSQAATIGFDSATDLTGNFYQLGTDAAVNDPANSEIRSDSDVFYAFDTTPDTTATNPYNLNDGPVVVAVRGMSEDTKAGIGVYFGSRGDALLGYMQVSDGSGANEAATWKRQAMSSSSLGGNLGGSVANNSQNTAIHVNTWYELTITYEQVGNQVAVTVAATDGTPSGTFAPSTYTFSPTDSSSFIGVGNEIGLFINARTANEPIHVDSFSVTQVPEPASVTLGLSAMGLLAMRRRRQS